MKIEVPSLEELVEIQNTLITLKTDAEMALDGEWDKSDEGFEAQIHLINKALSFFNKG
jgi:hypothetical protein